MSQTKIVATCGPASEPERVLRAMLRAGVDVFRLNVSHLEPRALAETTRRLRKIAAEESRSIGILADMPGPKIRCTETVPARFVLPEGSRVALTSRRMPSTPEKISVSYRYLAEDVRAGHEIAINDGLVLLRVERVDKKNQTLDCLVLREGEISSRKGVNFLHSSLRIRGLTSRDREGIAAAAEAGVDFIALSFVRSANDLHAARKILRSTSRPDIPLVSKIEQREAMEEFDAILEASQGIMVARGDMGIEQPIERVPLLQKNIIRRCNRAGRFVITATQMLESMTEHALPTRAEVSDVANAILDGTDAVMLSGETATGRDPANVVRMMRRIATSAETQVDHRSALDLPCLEDPGHELDDSVARAACRMALDVSLDALVCLSFYGSTARRISRYRPACPVYVLSPYEEQARQLAINWGVDLVHYPEILVKNGKSPMTPGEHIPGIIKALRSRKKIRKGQRIALLAGIPLGEPGSTNWLRVVEVDA